MMRRLLAVVVGTTCCLTTSGFTPSSELLSTGLHVKITRGPLPSAVESVDSSLKDDECLRDLPPVIKQIADERREFQINLGKAMDTLKKDMPYILLRSPGM